QGMERGASTRMRIGVISDTHGLLRPEAEQALQGVDLIVHAGDVGKAEILTRLKTIAPVFAVRGNVDTEKWAQELPETAMVEAGEASLYVIHNLRQLDLSMKGAGIDLVISGHTHQAEQWEREGVLYLNPGSAGPRRFELPVTLAVVEVGAEPWRVEIVELLAGG
ncbi:MAG TPA: metallophosphoesterase family protein, partial [Candidatus Acidoferrum sp.]